MIKRDEAAEPPAALSPPAAARYLGISRPTLDRLRRNGRLPSVKLGGRVLLRRETLDRFLRDLEKQAEQAVHA